MDIMRVTSVGKSSQSMGTKEICMLLVNDDHVCHTIAAYMLQHSINGEVHNFKSTTGAINAIWERKDRLELILTNLQKTDSRFGIIHHVEKEFKLPIFLMTTNDSSKILSKDLAGGAKVLFMKGLSMNEINNLWQHASAIEKGKMVVAEEADKAHMASIPKNVIEADLANSSSEGEVTRGNLKRNRKDVSDAVSEQNEGSKDDSPMEKKPRVVWSREMHEKFLEAIKQLGYERAFPKKIVELMNVPGLTRENVASHLQKYRMCVKRAQEGFSSSLYGVNMTNNIREPYFPSGYYSPFDISSVYGHSKQLKQDFTPSRQGFSGTSSMPPPSSPTFLYPQGSTSKSKLGLQFPYARNAPSFDAVQQNYGNTQTKFGVYGDQTKNVLFSIEDNSRKSTSNNFIGLRLASDGKSVDFGGQTRVPGNNNIGSDLEIDFSAIGTSRNEIPVQSPSTFNSRLPLQSPFLEPLQSSGQHNATLNNFIPQQQNDFPSSGSTGNVSLDQFPSTVMNLIAEIQPDFQSLGSLGNETLVQQPSASVNRINDQQNLLLPLGTTGNEISATIPQEEASLPPLLPELHEFSCFGGDMDLNFLLDGTGSRSPKMFWDADLDNALF
ncbi:hypothetical protein RJ639_022708 [Escallonia herrerae]|uniref:HTH myb-type domain-containing protein n=1 Tax=Escallonia herrerae TaxID=1293975 RepID=A0AA89AE21_9ASTE|nr:hypothetical protein RJ639_022708 [Escallonia herrerae]